MDTAAENNPTRGLSMDAGVEALLGTPSPTEEPKKKRSPEADEVTESAETVKPEQAAVTTPQSTDNVDAEEQPEIAEEVEDEDAEPDEDEADEDEAETADEDSEATDEEEADAEDEQEPVFSLEDGTEVNLDELKRGYLRQSDYTKKTQELAQGRQQLTELMGAREQEQQTLAENLNLALSVVEPQLAELAKTDWNALAQEDAYSYAEKQALFQQAQARYNALAEQSQKLVQRSEQERQAALQAKLQREGQALKMKLPDMADPNKAKKLNADIRNYATESLGLSEQEARGISDHRLVLALHKAMQFDNMHQGELTAAKKKLQKSPKRAMRAGQPKTQAQRQKATREAQMSKLKQTGKVEDALGLIMTG